MLLQLFGASVFIHTDVYEASEVVGPYVCLWTCTYIFVCVREENTPKCTYIFVCVREETHQNVNQ